MGLKGLRMYILNQINPYKQSISNSKMTTNDRFAENEGLAKVVLGKMFSFLKDADPLLMDEDEDSGP